MSAKQIVRGYIIPKRGSADFPVYSEMITQREASRIHSAFLEMLEWILGNYRDKFLCRDLLTAEELDNALNLIITYIKSLLYLDPIPEVLLSPLSGAYYYLLARFSETSKELPAIYTRKGIEEYESVFLRLYDLLEEKGCQERFRKLILEMLRFPADTRPAANTSSLLIHLLTTSAISCALWIERYPSLEKSRLVALRLASLFHDLGKMVEWHKHGDISARDVRLLFGKIVGRDSEAAKIVEYASALIQSMHTSKAAIPEVSILKEADQLGSNIDRLLKMLDELLSDQARIVLIDALQRYASDHGISDFGQAREVAFNDWSFWEDYLGIDKVKLLTEDFCKNASKVEASNPIFERKAEVLSNHLYVVRIDIKGIQTYIRGENLRVLSGGSRIIDLATYCGIPLFFIEKCGLPAEIVLYFGGGNVTILLPKSKLEVLDELSRCFREELHLALAYGKSPIYDSFAKINEVIEADLATSKMTSFDEAPIDLNIFKRCDFCGKNPASTSHHEKHVCELCAFKFRIGDANHFKVRISRMKSSFKELQRWDDKVINSVLEGIMEYIAGHSVEDLLQGHVENLLNISVIKVDGNLVGQLMASSTSISDAFERSVRIDFSVKEAFHSFLQMLREAGLEEHYVRLVLGVLYMGGDDALFFLPSKLAIPFTIHLLNEFYLNMGCKSVLSAGIASSKAKHPIVPLIEASSELLSIAKGKARLLTVSYVATKAPQEPLSEFRGGLAFYVAEGGTLTKETVTDVLSQVNDEKLSSQWSVPYILADVSQKDSILRLLNPLLRQLNVAPSMNKAFVQNLLSSIESKEFKDACKNSLRAVNEVMYASILNVSAPQLRVVFSKRQAERKAGSNELYQRFLFDLLDIRDSSIYFNLYDFYLALKLLLGGE